MNYVEQIKRIREIVNAKARHKCECEKCAGHVGLEDCAFVSLGETDLTIYTSGKNYTCLKYRGVEVILSVPTHTLEMKFEHLELIDVINVQEWLDAVELIAESWGGDL